jgi:hypothetical protein
MLIIIVIAARYMLLYLSGCRMSMAGQNNEQG